MVAVRGGDTSEADMVDVAAIKLEAKILQDRPRQQARQAEQATAGTSTLSTLSSSP